ncbi:hypothetical protein BH09MYX1_BH09MYX1_30590 [soil metagenome]
MSAVRTVDRQSLLADVSGAARVGDVEAALADQGLTLDLTAPWDGTVSDWIAEGAPGARSPWLDPADHLLAGYEARLRDGRTILVRPAPRRAVGPDSLALFFGTRGRFGTLVAVWIRVHPVDVARPAAPFAHVDPPLERAEEELWNAIATAFASEVSSKA